MKKVGHNFTNMSDKVLLDVLEKAEKRAKEAMTKIGMADELIGNNKWDVPPMCSNLL